MLYKAVALNDSAILVAWTVVPEDFLHGSRLRGYLITYRRVQGLSQSAVDTHRMETQHNHTTVNGLQPQSNYSFSVSAFTEHGNGPSSNTMIVMTLGSVGEGVFTHFYSFTLLLSWISPTMQ